MKKLFVTMCALMLSVTAFAQMQSGGFHLDRRTTYFGIRLGFNTSTIGGDFDSNSRTGLNLGFVAGLKCSPSIPLFLESGLYYESKGGKKVTVHDVPAFTKVGMDYLEIPITNIARKLSVGSKGISEKHKPFTDEEIAVLWGVQHKDLVKIILIWLYTGLRPNELFKTNKDNIHIEEKYFITGSKTEAGKNRIIPIHRKIEHLIKYFYLRENYLDIYEKTDYNKIKREFNKIMESLNMNHTPYDCRHTFITKMKKANANEYLLKRIVGHSIQDITEKTYTHRDIKDLLEEVNKIN